MKITQIRINGVSAPMGYDVRPLSVSWKVEEAEAGGEPLRTGIRLFEKSCPVHGAGAVAAPEGDTLILDTGLREDLSPLGTEIRADFKPRTAYRVQIRVRGSRGSETDTEAEAEGETTFETGKMEEPWKGVWIAGDDPDTPAVFRKRFEVRKEDTAGGAARLYILGLGLYEVYLNGKKVGEEFLAPGYHSYDCHLQYQTYDVSRLLADGENTLTVFLGDGWYRGRLGFGGGYSDLYGSRQCLIAELYQEDTLVTATDDTWEWHASPVVFSNIYDGEIFDAGVLDAMEEGWKKVQIRSPEKTGPLTDRYSLPVVPKERFAVQRILHTPKGETVLDFGQELTGWVSLRVPAEEEGGPKRGEAIRLTASEILQDGNFFKDNYRTARAEFTYISDGKVREVRPHHTFYCFRYVKIERIPDPEIIKERIPAKNPPEGVPLENRIQTVTGTSVALSDEEVRRLSPAAVHLRSDFDAISRIETADPDVNQLVRNATWGQKDNFLDVPTDCPQRDERLGWTGDAQIFSETACQNMDSAAFFRKYLWDMRAEQELADGAVANVVPRLKAGMVAACGLTPWADAGVVIPWNVYRIYGSLPMLREAYPGMKAWLDYARRKEEEKGGPHLNKDAFSFGDWLALDNPKPGPVGATDPQFIASAYYYQDAVHTAEAARILGYEENAEAYEELAGKIRGALQEKYFDDRGLCTIRTQTAAAMAVMFRLNPGEEARRKQGDVLADLVHGNGDHLNTGFVGTPLLCPALSETGHHDLAVTLLLVRDCPGWLYSVGLGATTIWERWNSVEPDGRLNPEGMNSLNHYSYGSILGWMYRYLAGIREEEPGYARAYIEPRPDRRLGHLACTMDTASGRYVSDWSYDERGAVHYHVEIPAGGTAEVRIDGAVQTLGPGRYDF